MTVESSQGKCLCGAVRFTAAMPSLWVAPGATSRGFCGRCGSPMFFKGARWPGELHVARALFTAPVDKEPQVHAYHDTHVPWVTLGDSLPRLSDPGASQ